MTLLTRIPQTRDDRMELVNSLLRVGKSGQWREQLPRHLPERFARELGAELAAWGYSA